MTKEQFAAEQAKLVAPRRRGQITDAGLRDAVRRLKDRAAAEYRRVKERVLAPVRKAAAEGAAPAAYTAAKKAGDEATVVAVVIAAVGFFLGRRRR